MTRSILRAATAAALICSMATAAVAETQAGAGTAAPTECPAAKPKKNRFGLGGLLSAARRAGVGDVLNNRMGGGMFGNGKGGQIAGAIAGTAVEAASSAAQGAATGQANAEAAPCAPAQGAAQ